jgi:lipoyl(octanoyl) transferase
MQHITFQDLGEMNYKTCWDLQEAKLSEIIDSKQNGSLPAHHLYFVEHYPVYTLGKSGQENNLLINPEFLSKIGATFYRINRGGDITFHGPGQIVGYPIFDLEHFGISVRNYIYKLEQAVIDCLSDYNISAGRLEDIIGVWIDPAIPLKARKICAIGVRVSRGVTMHGFAFNVNTKLDYFNHINPCGFVDKGVTSLSKEIGREISMDEVKKKLLQKMSEVFDFDWDAKYD